MTDQPKQPRIEIKGYHIEKDTFGEAVWALLTEYAEKSLTPENLAQNVGSQRAPLRNTVAAVCEAILIHGSAKWKLDAVELLGILAKMQHNIVRLVDQAEMSRAYEQRAAEHKAAGKEAARGPMLIKPNP